MATFKVMQYSYTIPGSLPKMPAVRTALFRELAGMTTGGDEFVLVDGGLAVHCADGRFKKKDLRGQRVNPTGSLGLVVISGDKDQIRGNLHALLTGKEEIAVAATHASDSSASPTNVRADGPWLEPLPPEFVGVDAEKLAAGKGWVRRMLGELGCVDACAEHFAVTQFQKPTVALCAVVHIDRNQAYFREYEHIVRPRWDGWIQTARRALPSAACRPDLADVTDGDVWPPPLPPEFDGVEPSDRYTPAIVETLERVIDPSIQYSMEQVLKHSDYFALQVVVHIDRDPEQFRKYEGIVRPWWDAMVQKARKALRRLGR